MSVTALRAAAKTYGIEDVSAWLLTMQGVVVRRRGLADRNGNGKQMRGKDCAYYLTATE